VCAKIFESVVGRSMWMTSAAFMKEEESFGMVLFSENHDFATATGLLGGGDLKNAALCALRSGQIEHNVGVVHLLAEVTERIHDRFAIQWRRAAVTT